MSNNPARGALAGAAAFFIWGLFPLFWSLLAGVPALELLAHRALWCAIAVWLLLLARRDVAWVTGLGRRLLLLLSLGGLLIAFNWGVYVWAVVNGHVIDTSLGYFLSPLVSVVVAVVVLRERLSLPQRLAVLVATAGVVVLGWQLGSLPWVALALAVSFGIYGLVRKLAPFDSLRGLAIESSVMLVPAAAWLVWVEISGQSSFLQGDWLHDALLVLGGPITAVPLVLFAYAAQRVSLLALGIMQYISPTVALLLGIWVFHEPFDGARPIAFGCIWAALALFSGEALWRYVAARSGSGSGTGSAAR